MYLKLLSIFPQTIPTKGILKIINHKNRTHQCKWGYQTQHITNYNFIKLKMSIIINFHAMLCYYFCSNTLSDMPIHTSLHTGSCLVAARSLHSSIHLSKYSTHVPYIQFIPTSVCHTHHQVLPNHFSSTSLNFMCMKI